MRKSTKTPERVLLEKYNILTLLKTHDNMRQIADKFGTTITTVQRVGEEQERLREINRFEKSKKEVKFLGTKGAWAELKSTQLYKQIMNDGRN